MPTFEVTGRVQFSGYEYFTKEIDADSESQAQAIFEDEQFYIETDNADIDGISITKTTMIDNDPEKFHRCEKTVDMFN